MHAQVPEKKMSVGHNQNNYIHNLTCLSHHRILKMMNNFDAINILIDFFIHQKSAHVDKVLWWWWWRLPSTRYKGGFPVHCWSFRISHLCRWCKDRKYERIWEEFELKKSCTEDATSVSEWYIVQAMIVSWVALSQISDVVLSDIKHKVKCLVKKPSLCWDPISLFRRVVSYVYQPADLDSWIRDKVEQQISVAFFTFTRSLIVSECSVWTTPHIASLSSR